jgi:hypothetical protein
MIGAIVSVAAQHPRAGLNGDGPDAAALRVFVLDGTPDGASLDGVLDHLSDALPQPTRVAGWRDTAEIIGTIAEEVSRRQADRIDDAPTILLAIHDISRLRDLRKSDDDFGFGGYSSRGEGESKPAPSKQFAEILKDGPGVGVHVIAWCDSLNNLNRTLDRATLREFEMRVLFQMSPNDSSALIDSPAAGRLGGNRGLFVSEEEGRIEKFRPFGIPPEAWWADVKDRLKPIHAV